MKGPGEFEIIERYFRRACTHPGVRVGIGDDAAILDLASLGPDAELAVATDTLVAGRHFPESIEAEAVGHRALAVNLSDLAAMGAAPRWWLLALTLPEADAHWLERFSDSALALGERFGACLVGGDLTRGPLCVTVHVLGAVARGKALRRAGAVAGDDIFVTGTLGDAAGGLALIEARASNERAGNKPAGNERTEDSRSGGLEQRFLYPTPRVEAGVALIDLATSAIDVSDGLVADLGHICESSGCGAVVDVERLPTSNALAARFARAEVERFATSGGDDYELLFTAPAPARDSVGDALARIGVAVTRIGRIVRGDRVELRRDGLPFEPPAAGFVHF